MQLFRLAKVSVVTLYRAAALVLKGTEWTRVPVGYSFNFGLFLSANVLVLFHH